VATLVLVDAAVLATLRPHADLLHHLAHPHAWLATAGADRATFEIAAAALWLVAAWLAVGLAASCCARLPGVAGRCAHAVAAAVLPRAVYRLAAGAAGLGVVLAPGLASASPAAPSTARAAQIMPAVPAVTSSATPSWPTDGAPHAPAWPTSAPPTSTPPTSAPPTSAPPPSTPATSTAGTPTRAAPAPTTPARAPTTPARAHPTKPDRGPAHTVVVRPGDSLWRIAAAHLPASAATPRIAAAWPRWYAANRRVIGDDPGHITPGQHLKTPNPPSAAAEEGQQ
jgi:hypothetical protein